jgi:hypothetical protein
MSNSDFLHEILNLRRRCLAKIEEGEQDNNNELINYYEQLMKWQEQMIDELKKFIQKKYHEIKQKYIEIHQQQIRQLDILYGNYLSEQNNKQNYSQLIETYQNHHLSIEILYPKPIDFNSYLQINTNDIQRSLPLINQLNLTAYQLVSTISIQSNLTPLFAIYDRLLVYYDHYTSSASLHIFDLKTYLEQSNANHHSCLKLRVPCNQFQGKIMHMEYSECLQGFLLATGSKLFLLDIQDTGTNYNVKEHFDIAHRNYLGIIQKFVCHPTTLNLIYFLINTLSDHTLVQMDLSKPFRVGKKWTYPKDDHHTTKSHSQLTRINDFTLGKDILIFAVTYQSSNLNKFILDDNSSCELHIRSLDMCLQHRFIFNSSHCPLRICMIPCDYSSLWNEREQFLLIYENSKILSLYDFNSLTDNDDKMQLIDEITLDTEPEYIAFANRDLSILLLRNHFDIAIYKQLNNNHYHPPP